jgi:hypothetical protein
VRRRPLLHPLVVVVDHSLHAEATDGEDEKQ